MWRYEPGYDPDAVWYSHRLTELTEARAVIAPWIDVGAEYESGVAVISPEEQETLRDAMAVLDALDERLRARVGAGEA